MSNNRYDEDFIPPLKLLIQCRQSVPPDENSEIPSTGV